MNRTVQQAIAEGVEALSAFGAGNPRFEAELLLADAMARRRAYLFAHPEEVLPQPVRARFEHLLERRLASEPLQYILGNAPFRHLDLVVRPGVLIPRSETEVLVEHALRELWRWRRSRAERGRDERGRAECGRDERGRAERGRDERGRDECGRDQRPWVIDVGVGSGAILLSLMKEMHESGGGGRAPAGSGPQLWFRSLGVDISAIALEMTARNAAANGLCVPRLALSDLLSAVDPEAEVALIASNPPYVTTQEMADLPAEIREHEPHEALHGGRDGLAAIRTLLNQARPFMERGTPLVFEIGGFQGPAVARLLDEQGLAEISTIEPDLAGRDRVVIVGCD